MRINPIKINIISNKKEETRTNRLYCSDTVSFKSHIDMYGRLPDDFDINNIKELSSTTPGILESIDTGYLAQIFKYKPANSPKVYAIKKIWPENLAKHVSADPVKQLQTEAKVYQMLGNQPNTPKFYTYNGDFSGTKDSLANNYIVMEWVDGVQISKNGTYYDLSRIDKSKLKKIYKLLHEFDVKGIFHNDLWAGNLLFTKNDVNIIDFNRASFFNPILNHKSTNLDSFKERFLLRYFSDVYQKKGQDELIDVYKYTMDLEISSLKNRARFLKSNSNYQGAEELETYAKHLTLLKNNQNLLKEHIFKEIYESDLRCGKIYAKYFEFEDDEAIESFKRSRDISQNYPEILDKNNSISSNLQIIKTFKNAMNYAKESRFKESLKSFEMVKQKLSDQNIYPVTERDEVYYQKFSRFCDININFLNAMINGSKQDVQIILDDNEQFFKETKRILSYFYTLKAIASE